MELDYSGCGLESLNKTFPGLNSEQLKGKILETFALVRNRVEAELHGSTRDFAGSDAHGKVIIASRWRAFSTGLFFTAYMGIFADIGIIENYTKGIKSMMFSSFFQKTFLGVSDKFSLRFLCLEVELLHRNKSPEKSHKKTSESSSLPPLDFQKMNSLWCRKTLVSAGSALPTPPLQKTAPHYNCLPGETILGGNQLSELSYCHLQEDRKDKSFFLRKTVFPSEKTCKRYNRCYICYEGMKSWRIADVYI